MAGFSSYVRWLGTAVALCLAACQANGGQSGAPDAGADDAVVRDASAADAGGQASDGAAGGPRSDAASPVELCAGGVDEDGDGLVDCADPDCRGTPVCREAVCDDGIDDDYDGDTDCVDPDCASAPACKPESCATYFDCLMAAGCSCTVGVDCPPRGSVEASQCMNACAAVPDCAQTCYASLSPQTQLSFGELRKCAQERCAPGQADCFTGPCLEPFAQCYFTGSLSCFDFLGSCVDGCGNDPQCVGRCVGQMSPQGYVDYTRWVQCLWDVCDTDGNHAADSRACLALGGFVACAPQGQGCLPPAGSGACGPFVQCVLHCENLADLGCVSSCFITAGLDAQAQPAAAEVARCAVQACGTTALDLTRACVLDALGGPCAQAWEACDGEGDGQDGAAP